MSGLMQELDDMARSADGLLPPIPRIKRLRLLKVIVQAVVVIDDGETLSEQVAQPVEVTAAEWPTYATGRFAEGFEALRRQVEGEQDG